MAALEELFANPKIAMGYGLLASRENPIGAAFGLLQQGQELQQRQSDNAIRNKLLDRQMRGLDMAELKAQREAEMQQKVMDTLSQGGDVSALAPLFVMDNNAAGMSYINDMKAKQETEASFNGGGAPTQAPSYDAPMEQPTGAMPSAFDLDLSNVGQDAPMQAPSEMPAVEPLRPIAGIDSANTPDDILQQLRAERSSPESLTAGGIARIKQLEAEYDRAVKIEEKSTSRISDAQKEQRQLTREMEKETRQASIANFDLVEGVMPTPTMTNDAAKKATALATYRNKKQSLISLLDQYGDNELFTPAQSKKIKEQFADIRNLERELGNTGVLNIGELPFLEETYATFNPLEYGNRVVPKDDLITNAKDYFANRESILTDQLQQMGYVEKNKGKTSKANVNVDMQKQAIEILRQRGAI